MLAAAADSLTKTVEKFHISPNDMNKEVKTIPGPKIRQRDGVQNCDKPEVAGERGSHAPVLSRPPPPPNSGGGYFIKQHGVFTWIPTDTDCNDGSEVSLVVISDYSDDEGGAPSHAGRTRVFAKRAPHAPCGRRVYYGYDSVTGTALGPRFGRQRRRSGNSRSDTGLHREYFPTRVDRGHDPRRDEGLDSIESRVRAIMGLTSETAKPGYPESLHESMLELRQAAYAPGTHRNYQVQASRFIKFMTQYGRNCLAPSAEDISVFITTLGFSMSHQSVANYISAAKSWVAKNDGDIKAIKAFSHPLTLQTQKGVKMTVRRPIVHATPILPDDLLKIYDYSLSCGVYGIVFKAVAIIAFFTALRPGHFISPSDYRLFGIHTLRRDSINVTPDSLTVTLVSSKTVTDIDKPQMIVLKAVPGFAICPLQSWLDNVRAVPADCSSPAFILPPDAAVTSRRFQWFLQKALPRWASPNATCSLHGFRRGRIQSAVKGGATLEQARQLRGWSEKSSSIYAYLAL